MSLPYKRFWTETKEKRNAEKRNWFEINNETGRFTFALATPTPGKSLCTKSSRN
jgi:hypothetical protein